MTLDWSCCAAVARSPEIVSGAWVFRDTRVPVRALFQNLEDGATVDDFLAWFPGVQREQVIAVLEFAERSLAAICREEAVVRILFDQGTPVPLRRALGTHHVSTAYEMGWASLSNGDLLDTAEAQFDVLVTTDQNLRYQQNLERRKIAILVLPFASWPKLSAHVGQIVSAIETMTPGQYSELSLP